MGERITATYRLRAPQAEARTLAEDICIEQTAESHRQLIAEERFEQGILGRVESLTRIAEGVHEARISYPQHITAFQLPQLLHVLYGNISLKTGIRLERLDLPASFTGRFPGPRHGIRGIRQKLGVHDRPLLAAALKPMGLTPGELASRARDLAAGDIDILKDDHGLADHEFCPFAERVQAVCEALRESGRNTLYLPSITDRVDLTAGRVDEALRMGAHGVLLSPMVTGLDMVRHLASRDESRPVIMAHPALTGAFFSSEDHGISHSLLLGTLMRLAGADMVIFPTHGGRFPFTRGQTREIVQALRSPLGDLDPAWPMPAGGIDVESVDGLLDDYGTDTIFLIGSSLYTRSPHLMDNASRFLSQVIRKG